MAKKKAASQSAQKPVGKSFREEAEAIGTNGDVPKNASRAVFHCLDHGIGTDGGKEGDAAIASYIASQWPSIGEVKAIASLRSQWKAKKGLTTPRVGGAKAPRQTAQQSFNFADAVKMVSQVKSMVDEIGGIEEAQKVIADAKKLSALLGGLDGAERSLQQLAE